MQSMIKLYRKLAKLVIHRQFALAVTSREIEVKNKNFDLLLVHLKHIEIGGILDLLMF
jgi:hypothetical protein